LQQLAIAFALSGARSIHLKEIAPVGERSLTFPTTELSWYDETMPPREAPRPIRSTSPASSTARRVRADGDDSDIPVLHRRTALHDGEELAPGEQEEMPSTALFATTVSVTVIMIEPLPVPLRPDAAASNVTVSL
jgi:hypothetical protein